jgi:hypothetical protein
VPRELLDFGIELTWRKKNKEITKGKKRRAVRCAEIWRLTRRNEAGTPWQSKQLEATIAERRWKTVQFPVAGHLTPKKKRKD